MSQIQVKSRSSPTPAPSGFSCSDSYLHSRRVCRQGMAACQISTRSGHDLSIHYAPHCTEVQAVITLSLIWLRMAPSRSDLRNQKGAVKLSSNGKGRTQQSSLSSEQKEMQSSSLSCDGNMCDQALFLRTEHGPVKLSCTIISTPEGRSRKGMCVQALFKTG